jgi:outer membrane protein TolC
VGTHSQSDVLSADSELAKLEENAFDFQRQISDAQSQINALMNRPANTPLGRPAAQTLVPVALTRENVDALALAHRPELFMAQKNIDAAQARLDAAHKEWIPDPSLRLEADRYNGAAQGLSEFNAGFSISLPWFNRSKYKAAIRENQKLLERAQHELETTRVETLAMVRDQIKKVETFHHHTDLAKTKLLPLAEQRVIATRLGYEADKESFLDLLTAQQSVQEIESMYWEHLADYQMALAELESLIGTRLEPATAMPEHQHDSK